MARSKSSRRWLNEHFSDEYVKRAQREGWRSRAVFKLEEIQTKYKVMSPGMTVVDLGAAPGGWSQYALTRVGADGRVFALDILPMEPLPGVAFIEGDFRDDAVMQALLDALDGRPVDLVISDIAPNVSGVGAVDQPRAMYLAELAMDFADRVLKPGGAFLVKLFQGEGSDTLIAALRERYESVAVRKPKASRPRSREVYALARGFKVV